MQIKSILAGAAIAFAVGMGSAHAAEQFTTLEGIAAQPLTAGEMVAVHGTGSPHFDLGTPPGSVDIGDIFDGGFPPPGIFDIVFGAPNGRPTVLLGCPSCPLPTP